MTKKYATVAEAVRWSGLTERTIRRMMAEKKLSTHRPTPGRVLIDLDELDKVIKGKK